MTTQTNFGEQPSTLPLGITPLYRCDPLHHRTQWLQRNILFLAVSFYRGAAASSLCFTIPATSAPPPSHSGINVLTAQPLLLSGILLPRFCRRHTAPSCSAAVEPLHSYCKPSLRLRRSCTAPCSSSTATPSTQPNTEL